MMKKSLFIFCIPIFLFSSASVFSQGQELYIPLEVQQAYQKETRSKNGTPGPNYWQNRSEYKINVSLEPSTRIITGEESVTYFNNSQDTLKYLVIRLYPDIFKKGAIRDEEVSTVDLHEGVTINHLTVGGKVVDVKSARSRVRRSGTNMIVQLPSPLYPASNVSLNLAWNYTLPKETHIREGTYGESSFFVAYWYPQIAVYDDISGWDQFNYTGTQEFYNDFGSFDVDITVPEGFVVWATGMLQNPSDVLTPAYVQKYHLAQKADEVVHIIEKQDLKKGNITKKGKNTWKFKAINVPDFAFASSNQYLWDATSALVDDNTGRRVTVGAAYNPASKDFYEVAGFGKQSIEYFSKNLPGIPFPYPNLTVFNGSGGMEFPMMVNDGSFPSLAEAAEVTAHEIAHSYFPFFMGINERKYAWMDEGWAQFLPNDIVFNTGKNSTYKPQQYNAKVYASFAGKEMEMPLMMPSVFLTGTTYGHASYFRPAVAYQVLQDMLGEELFKKALQEYMNRWNGKHPIPYDFFFTFNNVTNENLNWFWQPWFFERGYPDLGIRNVKSENGKTLVTIEKKGNLPVPVDLTFIFSDGSQETVHRPASVWKNENAEFTIETSSTKPIQKVRLGNPQIPDVELKDNIYAF